jgi:hypothetical protein
MDRLTKVGNRIRKARKGNAEAVPGEKEKGKP